jgi:O-antigen ligase
MPLGDGGGLHMALLVGVAGFLVATAAGSLYDVRLLPVALALGLLICIGVLVVRFPVAVSAAWLLLAGTSPEMWLGDLMPGYENTITAVVKVIGLALVGVCVLRYGPRLDTVNPAFAFMAMFITGLAHGLWPTLTPMDSVRSLIGSAAPFAFSFSRLSRRWCHAIITATIWVSPVIVMFGVLLAAAGLRPLFTDADGVLRLEGSTHPAFLGGFAMTGVYAALVELYRDGRNKHLVMIVVNFVILIASGARAPLACALVVTAAAFFMLKSTQFQARRRIPLVLAGALLLPVAVGLASGSSSIRLLNVLSSEAGDLSGRDLIWPKFEAAWDASPIVGWGIGAGKNVVDPDSLLARLLGTTAAHNEYLRMGVDGGYFGLALLILMMAVWAIRWTRNARPTDRFIMRAVFICFAVHSFTDNTLIAATASVLFAWISAVFARGELEREAAVSGLRASVAAERRGDAAQVA